MMNSYNPDVLSCLANLSNDEVFTPPDLANSVLDLLPAELWTNPNARFLDPVCKSGVFLREIAKRLIVGLAGTIPNLQKRIDHIFTKQLYGLAITELTSLLSRRSVYCSKTANGKYSVCDAFSDRDGNIRYQRMQHTWKEGRCIYCGASQSVYDRDDAAETYAYNFIHTDNPLELFNNMTFDVIIGNPPYQLSDGGGTGSSAMPIYHKFIEQAKILRPRYLIMIIPARWYSGGKGLDDFRSSMIHDKEMRVLVDYVDSRECFPGVDIAGGVCYFLWNKDYEGKCEVISMKNGQAKSSFRFLDEYDNFIRDNTALSIIHKVKAQNEKFLDSIVSSRMPFGIPSNVILGNVGDITLISSKGIGKVTSESITSGKDMVNKWKVLLSKTSNDHAGQPDKDGKRRIFSRIEVMPPNTVCTESYLVVGCYKTEEEATNMVGFLKSMLCRFLVSTILLTQNITKGSFAFVPSLSMTESWDDNKLCKRFGLDEAEVSLMRQQIKEIK